MGEPYNLSYGPYNVLIDQTVPFLTGVQHASGMQTAIENQIGASLHSAGKYIVIYFSMFIFELLNFQVANTYSYSIWSRNSYLAL
jgi:hypothetical protein